MQKVIIDLHTNAIVGIANDGSLLEKHQLLLDLPEGFHSDEMAEWAYDGQGLTRHTADLLIRAKRIRKSRIKSEAARLIEATDWKLARAREREVAGWSTLADVDAVLTEREAIRRSSNAAEVAVDSMTDVSSIQSFSWSIDVAVAVPRRLTNKGFSDRFSEAEMQAILSAAEANPALKTWWEKFKLARDINLDDAATQSGVQALEIAGLLAMGRAAEILA